jgi:hypothetical protein
MKKHSLEEVGADFLNEALIVDLISKVEKKKKKTLFIFFSFIFLHQYF